MKIKGGSTTIILRCDSPREIHHCLQFQVDSLKAESLARRVELDSAKKKACRLNRKEEQLMKKVTFAMALLALVGALGLLSSARTQTTMTDKPKLNVAILIFEGVQIIDYTGPYEVLVRGAGATFTRCGKA